MRKVNRNVWVASSPGSPIIFNAHEYQQLQPRSFPHSSIFFNILDMCSLKILHGKPGDDANSFVPTTSEQIVAWGVFNHASHASQLRHYSMHAYIIQAGSLLRSPPAIPESAIFHHNCVHASSAIILYMQLCTLHSVQLARQWGCDRAALANSV